MNDNDVKDQTEEQAKEILEEFKGIAYKELLRQHIAKKKSSGGAGTPSGT